jgi:hypothetical protein
VEIVVCTPASDFLAQHFPRTWEYLTENFTLTETTAFIAIYERQALADNRP